MRLPFMFHKGLYFYASLACSVLLIGAAGAQPINLKAKRMKSLDFGDHKGQLLTGDVSFEQSGSRVYCDRAEYDPQNETLKGAGNVRIVNTDGATVTGMILHYNNREQQARVEGNVILKDGSLILKAPWLEYNTQSKIGWYGGGGFIQDKETFLKSRRGRYDPNRKKLFFRGTVILETDDYLIQTDTLVYETNTKTAYFSDYTQINTADEQIILNEGYYKTEQKQGYFTKGFTYVAKNKRILCADTAFLDKENETGIARGRVWLYDSSENWMLYGQKGAYRKQLRYAEMFGDALAINTQNDSLWLRGDSIITEKSTAENFNITRGIGHVKMMQGSTRTTAQRLTHYERDSTIQLRGKPVIWDSISRMSGDSIDIYLKNNKIRNGSLYPNALIVNQESADYFSQIQGDSVYYALDTQQKIKLAWVYRNGKSIYYISENNEVNAAFWVSCTNMKFGFLNNKIDRVHFYDKPRGTLYPIDQIPEDKKQLERFVWDVENRPTRNTFQAPFTPQLLSARYRKISSIKPQPTPKPFFWFLKK